MGTPLRGELTRHAGAPRAATLSENLDNIGGVLSHVVRLSMPPSTKAPQIKIIPAGETVNQALGHEDAGAPWRSPHQKPLQQKGHYSAF